eukprot:GFUD01027413.1.p1 GENE.GFUD01027413.1~~GFUD01027413.1.p1  ORF type:complete len:729 (+),score=182.30 GFUD01027413.1:43-2229(+)
MEVGLRSELTPTQRKLDSDAKLQLEKENLAWLKEQCAESERLTSGMVDILESFEKRLGKLEETILPVYQETGNLQRRQENIDKTLTELDHVINYYNVSKEVENVVREGPGGTTLHNFLEAMKKLKGALDYFSTNNPGSIELENVRSLYTTGGSALSREFSELLKKHSRPISAIEILNSVSANDSVSGDEISHASSDDFSSISHFPEEVQSNMVQIAEWLCINDREEYMNVYANIRAHMMKKSLEQLGDHQKTASMGSQGRGISPSRHKLASPAAASAVTQENSTTPTGRKKSHQSKWLQQQLNKRMTSMSHKLEAATGVAIPVSRRYLGDPGGEDGAGGAQDSEVELFLTSITGLQRLMASEQQLMVGIIPLKWHKRIFEMITRDSLDMVAKEGEAITSRVRKSIASCDFVGVLTLFHLLRHMMTLKPLFDKTLEGCDPAVRNKYSTMLNGLQTSGTLALDGFIEGIRSDSTTKEKMPKDGTVFQLTSNILMYLEQLVDYMDTIADILGQNASYNQSILQIPRRIIPQDRPQALLGLYIQKVLIQLNYTLGTKSLFYSDPFLKAVFLLNNYMYILRGVAKVGLLDVVSLSAPECQNNYQEMITEHKRLYSQSWERVLHHIWNADDIPTAILMAPGKLQDKYCKIIKEKFSGFNREIEDISTTQKRYSIPDVELRESLKRDNKEYILPKYNSFYDKYANVQFSKNVEKYIKYTPAQVSGLIDSFFDVAA